MKTIIPRSRLLPSCSATVERFLSGPRTLPAVKRRGRSLLRWAGLLLGGLVGASLASGATLTTASYPAATLTQSTTFTDAQIPINTIEASGKVTNVAFTQMNLNRAGSAGGAITGSYTITGKFGYNADDASNDMYPQGMSTGTDSIGGNGVIDGYTWIVQTWDSPGDAKLSLLLFNWNTKMYRWVSLVDPFVSSNEVGADFREIQRHGDGIVWFKNYLYVADACHGFMVFDTNHVWQLSQANGTTGYDTAAHAFHGNGRVYVMPKIGHYRYTGGWTCPTGGPALAGCFLNRGSPNSYLCAWGLNGNIVKWALNNTTGLLVLDGSNIAQPAGGWQVSVGSNSLFSATIVGTNLYANLQPSGCTNPGALYKFPVTGGTDTSSTPLNGCTEAFVSDPYWNQIWMVSEAAGNKVTWAIRPP